MCVGELAEVLGVRGRTEADVRVRGRRLTVSLLTLDDPEELQQGDRLLVHCGYALARLTPQEAADAARIREGSRS